MPAGPELACTTLQPHTVSMLIAATSRISFSSSTMRIFRSAILFFASQGRFGKNLRQQSQHILFEIVGCSRAFSEELRAADGQTGSLVRREVAAGVDHNGKIAKPFGVAHPLDDREAVAEREHDVEDEQVGAEFGEKLNSLAAGV